MKLPRYKNIKDCVLITHKNCNDGSGCAILFMNAGGLKENIYFVAAGTLDKFLEENQNLLNSNKFIIIADVGLSEKDNIEQLHKRGNVVVLDHHKTNLHLKSYYWAEVNMNFCGTELLRQYLQFPKNKQELFEFSKLIDDFDRWQLKLVPFSERLASYHALIGQENFIDEFKNVTARFVQPGFLYNQEIMFLNLMNKKRDKQFDETLKTLYKRKIYSGDKMFSVGYSLCQTTEVSVLLNRILEENKDVDIACAFNVEYKSVSLRSRKEDEHVDVSQFAKSYGGGGHKQAAGHTIPEWVMLDIIESIHEF